MQNYDIELQARAIDAFSNDDYDTHVILLSDGSFSQGRNNMIEDHVTLGDKTFIVRNFPNPFNPKTQIFLRLPELSFLSITVFDLLGKRVMTLVDQNYPAGDHMVTWEGTDQWGNKVNAGVYFCRILSIGQSGELFTQVNKMILTK